MYRIQFTKDIIEASRYIEKKRHINLRLETIFRENLGWNGKFIDSFLFNKSANSEKSYDIQKTIKLVFIGQIPNEYKDLFSKIQIDNIPLQKSILNFLTFNLLRKYFSNLFEMDPTLISQDYMCNYHFFVFPNNNYDSEYTCNQIMHFLEYFCTYNIKIYVYLDIRETLLRHFFEKNSLYFGSIKFINFFHFWQKFHDDNLD